MNTVRYTVVVLVLVATSFAQPPNFDYPCFVTNPEGYITEDNEYLIPTFGDWDDDGDPDMMVGVLYYGNIYYYENISFTTPPEFTFREILMADGQAISVGFS